MASTGRGGGGGLRRDLYAYWEEEEDGEGVERWWVVSGQWEGSGRSGWRGVGRYGSARLGES